MTRVTDCLVIHRLHAVAIGLRERPKPAGGVERLVELAVDLYGLQTLERQDPDFLAVYDGITDVAVLVDDAVGRPRQRVLEHIVGVLRQGTHAQFYGSYFVKVLDQFIRRDADEARREPALRYECHGCAFTDLAHLGRNRDILRQVEVMQAFGARHFGDGDVAEIGQARDEGGRLVLPHVLHEGCLVARIQIEGHDRVEPMCLCNRFGDAGRGVG